MKEYKFKINGKDYAVKIGQQEGKNLTVNVNGADYNVELETPNQVGGDAKPAAQPTAPAASAPAAAPAQTPGQAGGAGKTIKSPLPGIIISIEVKEGQAVKRGQKVAVIEAMKMENDILAEADGTVTAIHARKGDSVLEGADIVTIG
ncbi:MAG: biotin/lipoyl-binding protein [Bacteroidales bacterium]|nr:biotin/lipoyl-binding protein [Bacteroidales bacterium]